MLREVVALSLEACAHFFTWIPLDGTMILPADMPLSLEKCVPFTEDFASILCQYAEADFSGIMVSAECIWFQLL